MKTIKNHINFKILYFLIFDFSTLLNKIILIFILFWSGFAFSLKESEISKVYELLDDQSFYQIRSFKGKKGTKNKKGRKETENKKIDNTEDIKKTFKQKEVFLRYAKFGKGKGKKGSIVFVNGWAENLLKYTELFYDLYLKGFSPIYTYDHRGQGFSDRLLSKPSISYVEDYSFYKEDLKIFIKEILKDPELNKENLFLIAHSMGGAIALDYLQTYPQKKYFKAVVLSAPLLKIQVAHPIFDFLILKTLKVLCRFFCLKPVPGIKKKYVERKLMTSSKARAKFVNYIEKKFPKTILSRPSYHWTLKSILALKNLMQEERIKKIKTPLLILQAEKEVLVSNEYQNSFCQAIPGFCRVKKLTGRHEHFLEIDKVRDKAIKKTVSFFSQ